MKKTIASICLCFMLGGSASAASKRLDLQARIDAPKVVLNQIMAAGDKSVKLNILQQFTVSASFLE